jgi:hypothetical protein
MAQAGTVIVSGEVLPPGAVCRQDSRTRLVRAPVLRVRGQRARFRCRNKAAAIIAEAERLAAEPNVTISLPLPTERRIDARARLPGQLLPK